MEPSRKPHQQGQIVAYQATNAKKVSGTISDVVDEIRSYLQQQKVLGTDRFRSWVEARTGRFTAMRPSGRPPRHL
jgi:hypothetical protein